jgi:pantoate--beta-alanine ligase
MSSRNAALTEAQRSKATDLCRALKAGRSVAAIGRKAVVDEVTAKLVLGFPPYLHEVPADAPAGPLFSVDYVDVVDPDTFERVEMPTSESLIIAAVRLGETRLIDNLPIGEPAEHDDQEAATDETARTTEKEG